MDDFSNPHGNESDLLFSIQVNIIHPILKPIITQCAIIHVDTIRDEFSGLNNSILRN